MSSYNLIPFTDLTATGFTNAVVTTSFTVNSFTVADATGADANRFIAVNPGSPAAPPFTFANDQRAGMWLNTAPTVQISFSLQGTTVVTLRQRNTAQALLSLGVGSLVTMQQAAATLSFVNQNAGFTTAPVVAQKLMMSVLSFGGILGMGNSAANDSTFSFFGALGMHVLAGSNNLAIPTSLGTYWGITPVIDSGLSFCKPGVLGQATTTVTPSTARSLTHVSNFAAGATVIFVTLPTSVAGLQYTISNAQATAQTVVVNPVAADTLNVFGLTKAAGASVAANAPFSSITFTCLTSTTWLATKKTGTWT